LAAGMTREQELLHILIARIETDQGLRPEELRTARRVVRCLLPVILRIERDLLAVARRTRAAED
jgi:hypothetical protein